MSARLVVFFLIFAISAGAEEYCSLLVRVIDSNDKAAEAIVAVQDRNGRSVEKMSSGGSADFCGLGILPVDVSVGSPGCNQVLIRNVPLQWGSTRNLKVVYDREPCLYDPPPVAACKILLRVVDSSDRDLGDAILNDSGSRHAFRSDQSGRILVRIPAGKHVRGSVEKPGYVPREIDVPCDREHMLYESRVVLEIRR